jgi:hypothetical protein
MDNKRQTCGKYSHKGLLQPRENLLLEGRMVLCELQEHVRGCQNNCTVAALHQVLQDVHNFIQFFFCIALVAKQKVKDKALLPAGKDMYSTIIIQKRKRRRNSDSQLVVAQVLKLGYA